MYKKGISVILTMLCFIFLFNYSAYGNVASETYDNKTSILLLNKLGVITNLEEYDENDDINRGEFVSLVVRMLGLYDESKENGNCFFDVDSKYEFSKEIAIAYYSKIISGTQDGYFYPNKNITLNEAISILIKAVHYSVIAEEMGGYPNGYYMLGQKLNLYNGVNQQNISKGSASRLIYNTMLVNVMQGIMIDGKVKYEVLENENYLNKVYNVYEVKGILDANNITAIPDGNSCGENQVTIDGILYNIQDKYISEMIGYRVDGFYKQENDDKNILMLELNKNAVLTVRAIDAISYGNSKFVYKRNDKNIELNLDNAVVTMLNGKTFSFVDPNTIIPNEGEFLLIDNNQDSEIDVVKISSYEMMIVEFVDEKNKTLYGNGEISNIDLSDFDTYNIINEKNEELKLSDIKANNVISVARSSLGGYLKIIVTNDIISDKVISVEEDNDGRMVITLSDEKQYYVYKNTNLEIVPGNSYEFALNHYGDIYGIVTFVPTLQYGYFIEFAKENMGRVDFKLAKADGKFITVEGSNKITLTFTNDGNNQRETIKLTALDITDYLIEPQVIRYLLNKKNELIELELANINELGEGLRKVGTTPIGVESLNNRYRSENSSIGGQVRLDIKTKVLVIPYDSDATSYTASNSTYFVNYAYYLNGISGYTTNNESTISEFIVVNENNPETPYTAPVLLVDKFGKGVDSDGNEIYRVYGLSNGEYVSLPFVRELEDTFSDFEFKTEKLSKGDILRYNLNSSSEIDSFKIIFDYSRKFVYGVNNNQDISNTSTITFGSDHRQVIGKVSARRKDAIYLTYNYVDTVTKEFKSFDTMSNDKYILDKANIYIFDSTTSKMNKANYYDIADSEKSINADFVFISTVITKPKIVVIYR